MGWGLLRREPGGWNAPERRRSSPEALCDRVRQLAVEVTEWPAASTIIAALFWRTSRFALPGAHQRWMGEREGLMSADRRQRGERRRAQDPAGPGGRRRAGRPECPALRRPHLCGARTAARCRRAAVRRLRRSARSSRIGRAGSGVDRSRLGGTGTRLSGSPRQRCRVGLNDRYEYWHRSEGAGEQDISVGGAVCLHRRPIRANGRSPARQAINVTVTYCMGSAPLYRPPPLGALCANGHCQIVGRRNPVLTVRWLRKSEENLMARMFSRITLN